MANHYEITKINKSKLECNKRRILRAIYNFRISDVQAFCSLQAAITGFNLFQHRWLTFLMWNYDNSAIGARIWDGYVYFSCNVFLTHNKQLTFHCTCNREKAESNYCEHAVCMLHSLTRMYRDSISIRNKEDDGYFSFLLKALNLDKGSLQEQVEYPLFPIDTDIVAITINNSVLKSFIFRQGYTSHNDDSVKLPLVISFSEQNIASTEDELIINLKRQARFIPVTLNIDGKSNLTTFDPTLVFKSSTEINSTKDFIKFAKQYQCCENMFYDSASISAIGRLILNHETKRLGVIEGEDWSIFNKYYRIAKETKTIINYDNKDSFSIPQQKLQDYPIQCIDEHLITNLNLKKDGLISLPQHLYNSYKVIAKDYVQSNRIIIAIECKSDIDFNALPSVSSSLSDLYNQLKIISRTVVLTHELYGLFLEICSESNTDRVKQNIDVILSLLKLKARQQKKCHKLIWDYWSGLHLDIHLSYDKQWIVAHFEKRKELMVYKITSEIFGSDVSMELMEKNEMFVQPSEFYRKIQSLYDRLSEHGIGLIFNRRPVRRSRMQFTFDATRNDINWFEIRPEIQCEGKALDDIAVDELFASCTIGNEKFINLLDGNTRKVLERIAAAYRASDEQCRNYHGPVRVPRLLILDWAELRRNGVTVQLPPKDDELVRRLLNFEQIDDKPLPKGLQASLRPYQQQGYSWLAFLYEHRLGACLADDMGLGKTVQAISLLGGISEGLIQPPKEAKGLPHLIVVPSSLVFNWEHEIVMFYPKLKVHVYTGSDRSDDFDEASVVLTTYGTVRRDIEELKKRLFHIIIFDEAQAVKNIYADTTDAVRQLRGLFKLAITGTPIENHLGEYYSIVDLAMPGLLGDYERFRPLIKLDSSIDIDVLIRRTKPFILRRTKESVLTDLPPKIETDIYLDLTENQKALYQKTAEQIRADIDDAYQKKTPAQAKIIALTAILKLRQICITPQLIDPNLSGVSPKMDFLIQQLQKLREEGHSALVFSQFTSFLDILGEALEKTGIGYLRLDGSTRVPKRKSLVQQFQSGDNLSVFLLSLKAGGQGLNLTSASYVFHIDPWWNPAVESQASDRSHRIGQKNKVTIVRLLMRHTIEEKMMELKKLKSALYNAILGAAEVKDTTITRSDFDFLLNDFLRD